MRKPETVRVNGKLLRPGARVLVLRRDWLGVPGVVHGVTRAGKIRVKIAAPRMGPLCILSLHPGELEPCGK